MKVAFCIRADYDTKVGGDSIQCLKTKENLEALFDIKLDIVTDPNSLNASYDIVHIFNLATQVETGAFFAKARSLKLKIALSPIFWDYYYTAAKDIVKWFSFNIPTKEWHINAAVGLIRITSFLLNKPRIISSPFKSFCRKCIQSSNILLPNSIEEFNQLARFVGLRNGNLNGKAHVVINATEFPNYNYDDFENDYKLPPNFVLQVARIEFAKNQLNVVRALFNHPEIPIVFIGRPHYIEYAEKLYSISKKRGNVFFFNHVPHEKIYAFYKHAALHILPSFRESPGLVSLEALSQQCKIVVADKRFTPVDTYFKGLATIINPSSVSSIRNGILCEMKEKRDMNEIRNHIKNQFTWTNAARATFEAYNQALSEPS